MAKALLLVTMEPPASLEEEFNDWYDTEHFPQRRGLPGFESASRWVCLEGWPRWLALYDIADTNAVETPAYQAVSGSNATPWSRRILPRTVGRARIVCRQAVPGAALGRPPAQVARLVVARYPERLGATAQAALGARAAELPGLLQLRAFETVPDTAGAGPAETWVLAEFDRVPAPDRVRAALAEVEGLGARLLNTYAPYLRGPAA
jgi:hypothetical protein